MSNQPQEPDTAGANGRVADAVADSWVDSAAPTVTRPYLRLSRVDRPIGTWLLLLPCWWGLLLAIAAAPGTARPGDIWIFAACAIGALVMRGAGCTWNDLVDRDLDARVQRTRSRPLPSGQVTVRNARLWLVLQAAAGFAILMTFNRAAIVLGFVSLIPVVIYPFAKRITWWPQVALGIAFNWGALLAWAAHSGSLGTSPILLYLSGICWTLFYDTIYAHQDKEDDALIGIKSTARLFGDSTVPWLYAFGAGSIALMAAACLAAVPANGRLPELLICLAGAALFGGHLVRQIRKLDTEDSETCLILFRSNRDAGLIPALAFLIAGLAGFA